MIYVYEGCCGASTRERICSLKDYELEPSYQCPDCARPLAQIVTAPSIYTKAIEPFRSPVDGSIISTRRQLAEHNRRNNVVNLHDGYTEKEVQSFTARPWNKDTDQERHVDLAKDMEQAIEKLQDGYKPTLAPYTEECPDA